MQLDYLCLLIMLSKKLMSIFQKLSPILVALGAITTLAPVATADTFDKEASRVISGPGTALYLGTGIILPLLQDGKVGGQRTLRALDSVVTSTALCVGLKQITQVKRPDSDERDSFPALHATAGFALAATQSHYHPDSAWLWYSGAGLIAYSRVNLNRHSVYDVVAGAVLGYFTSKIELNQRRGLILFPFIDSDNQGNSIYGLQVQGNF